MSSSVPASRGGGVTLFVCGDVMTGRGVDQILAHPGDPRIVEAYVHDARDYVALAERRHGPIPRSVPGTYIWGDALSELDRVQPAVRLVNLETSVTVNDEPWAGKGINYRMHPANVGCLTAARLDVCVLANNHVIDYGRAGLVETLETLARARIGTAGAGRHAAEAQAPAIVPIPGGGRVIVLGFGIGTSGIPASWAAGEDRPGVDLLPDLSEPTAAAIAVRVRQVKAPGDLVIASIHWGTNWGYDVPRDHVRFAHRLIDDGVDLVHGHSSHHPRPIEVYRNRPILYGCGDFINDYEGIQGYEEYRGDLVLMYFPSFSMVTGELVALDLTPMRIRHLSLHSASPADAHWLRDTLDRVSAPLGSRVDLAPAGRLTIRWEEASMAGGA